MESSFQINQAGFDRQFKSSTGETLQWLKKIADEVATKARDASPKPGSHGSFATGKMAASITTDPVPGGPDLAISVIINSSHAIFVHEGTRPHGIKVRNAPMLRFFWDRVGHVVEFKEVNHPGSKANPFLRNALNAVVSRFR